MATDYCLLGILQPNLPSAQKDVHSQLAPDHSHHHKTPQHSGSSLVDTGSFKSPSDEIFSVSIIDDFDTLLLQLKCLGNMDLAISRWPNVQDQHTVPYFPPVTSALRREHGMFNCEQSSCVEYADDKALLSPQFLQMTCSAQDYVASLADVSFPSSADFEPLSTSLIKQLCSRSCPDVNDQSRAAADNAEPCISMNAASFNGLNSSYLI